MVAARSWGSTRPVRGYAPFTSLDPYTCPPEIPAPARAQLNTGPQWSRPFLSLPATHPSIRNSSYLHPPTLQSVHQMLPTESLRRRRRELDPFEDLRGSEALNTRPITLENHFLDGVLTIGGAFLEARADSNDDDDCLLNGFLSTVCVLTSLCSIATGQHSLRWRSVGCD